MQPGDNSSLEMTATAMIGLGKTGKDIQSVKSSSGNTPFTYLKKNSGDIDHASILAKAILALNAVNENPRSLGGVDLVSRLERKMKDNPTSSGKVNVAAYSLMALRAVKAESSRLTDTEKWLCKAQNNDGGWGISADARSDADTTGAVLQVVGGAGFKGDAIGFLRGEQANSGGFTNGFSGTNSQSTALAVQGMLGANYAIDNLNNGGNTALDYLARHQKEAGFIAYDGNSGKTSSVWVTSQALPSMAEKGYFGGTPRDCNDYVSAEDPSGGGSTDSSSGGSSVPSTTVPSSSAFSEEIRLLV